MFIWNRDNYIYNGSHSRLLYLSDSLHRISLRNLDEAPFPPVGYFFTLFHNLLGSTFLTYGQCMEIVRRHFYTYSLLPPRFQKKLYLLDLIERDMTSSAISSTFGFENLSQDVLSVILGYADINSARNMLLVSNLFYFGARDCLTHCHERVFEIYRTSFIEQLLPLFTQVEKLNDNLSILQILCRIYTNFADHALNPLNISNTFEPVNLSGTSFVNQFRDLVHGLYPFAPCISTREYYYLLRSFILYLLPSTIFPTDPLKSFELTILSNKFSFDHFLGYMDNLLSLMKKANLTAFTLGLDETSIRYMLSGFTYWYDIRSTKEERTRVFYLCLVDMSYTLSLLKDPLTNEQFDTIIERLLTKD
jgi:hypothetical protein